MLPTRRRRALPLRLHPPALVVGRRAPASPTRVAASARAAASATISASTTASAAASAVRAAVGVGFDAASACSSSVTSACSGSTAPSRRWRAPRPWPGGAGAARRRPASPAAPAATTPRPSTCASRPRRPAARATAPRPRACAARSRASSRGPGELGDAGPERGAGDLRLRQRGPFGQGRSAVAQPVEREVTLLDGQQQLERAHASDPNGGRHPRGRAQNQISRGHIPRPCTGARSVAGARWRRWSGGRRGRGRGSRRRGGRGRGDRVDLDRRRRRGRDERVAVRVDARRLARSREPPNRRSTEPGRLQTGPGGGSGADRLPGELGGHERSPDRGRDSAAEAGARDVGVLVAVPDEGDELAGVPP